MVVGRDTIGQGRAGAGINQKRFGGDPFGVNNLVIVEQDLEIIHEPAVLLIDRVAVDQMAHLYQYFGSARANAVFALVDKQAVIGEQTRSRELNSAPSRITTGA